MVTAPMIDLEAIDEPTIGKLFIGVESDVSLQGTPLAISSPIDGQRSTNTASAVEFDEDDQSPQTTPLFEADLSAKRIGKYAVGSKRRNSRSRAGTPVRPRRTVSDSEADTIASFMRNRTTAWNAKVQRVARNGVAKLRFQCRRKSHVAGVPVNPRVDMVEEAANPQRSANGQATLDSSAEVDGSMVGLEFSEQNTGSVEVGEPMDLTSEEEEEEEDAGDVDQVMIGSDVDGEMEVDEEAPDSDGDPMQLEEDGPQLAISMARKRVSFPKKPRPNHAKVFNGRVSREKAAIPLRQPSKRIVNSGMTVSNPVGGLIQPSQQQAVPVPVLVAGNADTNSLQPVAQNLISTNSPVDLKEARLGKRAEARVPPVTETQSASPAASTSSPKESKMTESEDVSDATEPTSTLPSSTTSSLPQDTAPSHNSPPKSTSTASETQTRKKRSGDNSDATPSQPPTSPSSPSPEQSSKRFQQQRRADDNDQEIIPLNDMVPSQVDVQTQRLQAEMDSFPHDQFPDPDLDWTSDEEGERKNGKGKGKKEVKTGKSQAGKGQGGQGKGEGKEQGK